METIDHFGGNGGALIGLDRFVEKINGQLAGIEPIAGDLEQRVYRVAVRTTDGLRKVIYKRITPQEGLWYGQLRAELGPLSPRPLALEVAADRSFVVLPDLGPSVKELVAVMPEHERVATVIAVARRLAALHADSARLGKKWSLQGFIQAYPIASSIAWGRQSLQALDKFSGVGVKVSVDRWQRRADQIYAHLEEWSCQAQLWTLIHGDPHLGNLLRNEDGQLTLVDWEYVAMAPPQRDITVLMQDVLDPKLGSLVLHAWRDSLAESGLPVDGPAFCRMLEAGRFDNTLMMLAYDIRAFGRGETSADDLQKTLQVKLGWLEESFERLAPWL